MKVAAENLRFNETAFVFPFSYEGGLKKWEKHFENKQLEIYWEKRPELFSKFFLKHVLNQENRPLHYEYREGSLHWNYEQPVQVLTTLGQAEKEKSYTIKLVGYSLFVFPTGVGCAVVRVKYDEKETISEIANLSATFSRIFPNEQGRYSSRVRCMMGEESISLRHLLQDSVGQTGGSRIEFFPCTNTKRAFVFHRLQAEQLTEQEKAALRRNLWIHYAENVDSFLTELEEELVLNEERLCLLSPMVMCLVASNMRGTDEDIAMRENSVRFLYFNVFLLCIHEQQALMLYEQKRVLLGKRIRESKRLKKELLRFLPSYSFKVISLEITYQQMYLSLQKILHLETLEERLEQNISMLEAAYNQRRDAVVNSILFVLSLLGVVSLVGDIMTLISLFGH